MTPVFEQEKLDGDYVILFHLHIVVMERFGNLKVGSVFGIFHPETAVLVLVFSFQKKK